MRQRSAIAAALGLWMGLNGCTLEPAYHRPAAPVADQWSDTTGGAGSAAPTGAAVADIGWRDFFADARLQKLIEIALQHNPDARSAALNIIAARAQYQIQRADLFPSIAASATEQVEKYPAAVAGLATGAAAGGATGAGTGTVAVASGSGVQRYFDVGVGFTSYEIDLFGRVRSLNHERLEQYFGYVETRRSTQISLVAAVANAYLALLADRDLLRITQDTLNSQQDSLQLVQMSFDGGVATALDLHQAETTVLTARANLAQYTRQVAQDENALVVLLGTPLPADLPAGTDLDQQRLLTELPGGLPSEMLTRRPDILAAEHNLIAANANIGAARAAFFPSITLTGTYGTASTQLSGLFDHGSTAWTFSPQISLPIFAGGANVAALKLSKVQKDVYVVQYEQAIQAAFREVADGLVGRATWDSQLAADQALVDATSESYRLSDMRYKNGVDNFLIVLDSQRSLFTAQQALVAVKLARLQNLVTLYKAMGGGWRETNAATAAVPVPAGP
jgi:outer membrane protein, multidrug efflux system